MIEQGQHLPSGTLSELTNDGMKNHDVTELFAHKKVILFVAASVAPTCCRTVLNCVRVD